ncbi:MAG: hypothetical protein CL448_02285 [Acidimicrobiaceae bacterium]|nr:hypothetical protein [Acidimicrobiaceae bacterium]
MLNFPFLSSLFSQISKFSIIFNESFVAVSWTWHYIKMNYQINPRVISPPAANYSHAVLSTNPEKILHTSGVVPVTTDGSTPVAIRDQADLVWLNITNLHKSINIINLCCSA